MNPTPTQTLLLFGLLARHGECPQAELVPAVKKADREALAKAKLIAVGRIGRGVGLTLADAGWAWAAAHLDAELPPPQRTLSDMLVRLGEHLRRSGGTLADVIGAKPGAGPAPKPLSPATAPTKTASSDNRRKASAGSAKTAASASPASSKDKAARPGRATPAAVRKRIETA